jgi:ABC-type multidrug transport system ATPase subunit
VPLGWLTRAEAFRAALALVPSLTHHRPIPIGRLGHFRSLKEARGEVRFGRDAADPRRDIVLADESVSFHHAVAVHAAEHDWYWIADAGSAEGTFVNGEPIAARRLVAGDLVQIGPFAWVFSESEGRLEPAPGIAGMRLDLVGAGVLGRLRPMSLSIAPAEFIGIVGPSGSGKSTLLKALIGLPGHLDQGRLLAHGRDVSEQPGWFRSRLGYVSQDKVVHEDLTPLQAVAFSAALRGRRDIDAESLLRQVDLERARWNARIGELSGGQEKRVRIAAELANSPGLVVLDEPGSGLDWAREADLMRLLKTLTHRGCTVVVVTHNLNQLATFDRVLMLRAGELVFDGPPDRVEAGGWRVAGNEGRGNHAEVGLHFQPSGEPGTGAMHLASGVSSQESGVRSPERRREKEKSEEGNYADVVVQIHNPAPHFVSVPTIRNCSLLIRRELASIANRRFVGKVGLPLPHVLVPLVVIPVGFATACHLAVKPFDRAMLGFLGVLSCIWMGASLSLTSIVNEREVFDHERLLFLRVGPYVAAKTFVLSVLSALEALVYFTSLLVMRGPFTTQDTLFGGIWPAAVLALVAMASMGVGLLLSAVANRNKPLPNLVLPLVMIAQVLFSVQVAGDGKASLHRAYGEFHAHRCRVHEAHEGRRRAERWLAPSPGGASGELASGWYCSDCEKAPNGAKKQMPESDIRQDHLRPNLAASLGSYLTISRYGDIALRSFAYFKDDALAFHGDVSQAPDDRPPAQARYGYRRWRVEAISVLALLAVAFPAAAAIVLQRQTTTRGAKRIRIRRRP